MATSKEVAQWMVDRIQERGYEDQEFFVREIGPRFGAEWDYVNNDGNPVIDPKVLRAFRKLHAGAIEWEPGERRWSVRSGRRAQ